MNGMATTVNKPKIIKKYTLIVEIAAVLSVLLSYIINHAFVFVACAICVIFLLSNVEWEQRFSLFYFLFPFSWIFTFDDSHNINLFMFLRIAIIIAVIIYNRKLISTRFISLLMFFTLYCLATSGGSFDASLKQLLNVILWFLIVFITNSTIDSENVLPVSIGLSNGVIVSGIVAMNIDLIPNLEKSMRINNILGVSGEIQNRFTGLFSDPNIYTVLICAALWAIYYEFSRGKLRLVEYSIRAIVTSLFGLMTMSKSCAIILILYWMYVIFSINNINLTYKVMVSLIIILFFIYYLLSNPEWYINMVNRLFGNGSNAEITINDVTTGRYEIWGLYIDYFYHTNSWVFGNGLGALLPNGRAAHNTIIQIFYCTGLIGVIMYYKIIKFIYHVTPSGSIISGVNKIGIYALLFLIATLLFLDGLLLEIYYHMISLIFIYMKSYSANDSERLSDNDMLYVK